MEIEEEEGDGVQQQQQCQQQEEQPWDEQVCFSYILAHELIYSYT